jgi:hypothetical protein
VTLDGTWSLERTGGVLPPLGRMRKEIHGDCGWTIAAGLKLRFEVVGLELRYRLPLRGLVDVLAPAGPDVYTGTARLFGRSLGTFRMTRVTLPRIDNRKAAICSGFRRPRAGIRT